ncbi:MAG: hypothetical protein MJ189_05545 [Coriobacteriales bacterium]|nr:hypothetical protein [Coriobacteriales bacterium]
MENQQLTNESIQNSPVTKNGVNPAYFVAAFAVLGIIMLFTPWVNLPAFSQFASLLNVSYDVENYILPQSFFSVLLNADDQFAAINNFLDLINSQDEYSNTFKAIEQAFINLLGLFGVDSDFVSNIDNIVKSIIALMPSSQQIMSVQEMINQFGEFLRNASFAGLIMIVLIIAFNLYTFIYCVIKKKANKLCFVGFIIEAVFCVLAIVGCYVINLKLNNPNSPFFISTKPLLWVWVTLVLAVIAVGITSFAARRNTTKGNAKTIIFLSIFVAFVVVVAIGLNYSGSAKESKFIGSWCVDTINVNSIVKDKDLEAIKEKGIDESNAIVITVNDDFSFDSCLAGLELKGNYRVDNDVLILEPTTNFSSSSVPVSLAFSNDNLVVLAGPIKIASLKVSSINAQQALKDIRLKLGKAALESIFETLGGR